MHPLQHLVANYLTGGFPSYFSNRFVNRVLHKLLWAIVLPGCALWGVAQAVARPPLEPHSLRAAPDKHASTELPRSWQGAPLRPLALSEVELRFAQHFPGSIARMTDGKQVLVLRTVTHPTRMLHPAADCYRGLGYRIHSEQLKELAAAQRWRCFVAERSTPNPSRVRVCERIEDAQGQAFTDASSRYWAAISGQSSGPWQAVTVAAPL